VSCAVLYDYTLIQPVNAFSPTQHSEPVDLQVPSLPDWTARHAMLKWSPLSNSSSE
jgi:hypothetical protein